MHLPPPPATGQSAIWSVRQTGRDLLVYARSGASPMHFDDLDLSVEVRVEVWLLDESLDALGLVEGELSPVEIDAESRTLLEVAPRGVGFGATVEGGHASGWSTQNIEGSDLQSFRFPALPCWDYDPEQSADFPIQGPARVLEPIDSERALLATKESKTYIVSEEGAELIDAPVALTAAYETPGRLWLGTVDAKLILATFTSSTVTFVETSSVPNLAPYEAQHFDFKLAAGIGRNGEPEVFAATHGLIHRYSGGRWEYLWGTQGRGANLEISWSGPGRALVMGAELRTALRIEDGVIIELPYPTGLQRAETGDHILGYGDLLGSRESRIFRYSDALQAWELDSPPLNQGALRDVAAIDGGFAAVFKNTEGYLSRYRKDLDRYCTPKLFSPRRVGRVAGMGTSVLIAPASKTPDPFVRVLFAQPTP